MIPLENLGRHFLRAVRQALGHVLRASLFGLVLGGAAGEGIGLAFGQGWPPSNFVHVVAGAFALLLAYAAAITTALVQGIRGLVAAASGVDDVVKAAADAGVNAVDAVVDAVDGPNRHGIR